MIFKNVTVCTKGKQKKSVLKSVKLNRKHVMRFCKSKCDMCNFIKKCPKLKEVVFILPIIWHSQNKQKSTIKYDSIAMTLKSLLDSQEILSTLNTHKEEWYHYVLSGIVSSYIINSK